MPPVFHFAHYNKEQFFWGWKVLRGCKTKHVPEEGKGPYKRHFYGTGTIQMLPVKNHLQKHIGATKKEDIVTPKKRNDLAKTIKKEKARAELAKMA